MPAEPRKVLHRVVPVSDSAQACEQYYMVRSESWRLPARHRRLERDHLQSSCLDQCESSLVLQTVRHAARKKPVPQTASWVTSGMISNQHVNWSMNWSICPSSGHISYQRHCRRMVRAGPYGSDPLDALPGNSQGEPLVFSSLVCSDSKLHMWRCVTGHPQTSQTTRISFWIASVSYPDPDDQLTVHCETDRWVPCVATWEPPSRNTAQSRSPTSNTRHHFSSAANLWISSNAE